MDLTGTITLYNIDSGVLLRNITTTVDINEPLTDITRNHDN